MDSALISIGLPIALAVIMFGLGLDLTPGDFRRVGQQPRVVALALICQLVVLPLVAFVLVSVWDLEPLLAVGFMILAASPGGTTANLMSHLFRGDVALNITLTAINSVIAIVTLPLITNWSLGYFLDDADRIGLQFDKLAQVFAIVLVPVIIGMLVRRASPGFAARMDRPVRIASAILLLLVIVGAMLGERENIAGYLGDVGLIAALFCILSLTVGYVVPRRMAVPEDQSIACGFEIGIHNSTLAIAVALTVLESTAMAIPSAIHGIVMFPIAAACDAREGVMAEVNAAPATGDPHGARRWRHGRMGSWPRRWLCVNTSTRCATRATRSRAAPRRTPLSSPLTAGPWRPGARTIRMTS